MPRQHLAAAFDLPQAVLLRYGELRSQRDRACDRIRRRGPHPRRQRLSAHDRQHSEDARHHPRAESLGCGQGGHLRRQCRAAARRAVKGKVTLWPLITAVYLMVSGGPFGLEDTVSQSGYLGAILILLITPLIWALPTALMVAELAGALPKDGGYYVWAKRSMGPFWGFQEAWLSLVGSIFDMALYPTLFVSYVEHFHPALTANGKGLWIGASLIGACALYNMAGAKAVGFSSFAFTAL